MKYCKAVILKPAQNIDAFCAVGINPVGCSSIIHITDMEYP